MIVCLFRYYSTKQWIPFLILVGTFCTIGIPKCQHVSAGITPLGGQISIECGTRQGGLTSLLIFNLFYEELISDLNQLDCGITIGNSNYNVICYADDILICSLTVTGLQKLIDTAMSYTENYGLNFSAAKTTCVSYGKNYFKRPQNWTIKMRD